MAVLLEMVYGKKIGLPEYSSHNFSVSLKVEVANLENIHEEVERVYQTLQTSVDEQIVHPGFIPGRNGAPCGNGSNGNHWQCSGKQKDLILKIVGENGFDRNKVDQLAVDRFGRGVKLLNKLEASGLIDELLGQNGRGNGKRNGSRSRAHGRAA